MIDKSAKEFQEPVQTPRAREAFQKLLAEIVAVPEKDVAAINVDVANSVSVVLGVWKELVALRPRIVSELPAFDIARFDKLEGYAMALWHAHSLYQVASGPVSSLQTLYEEGTGVREMLLSDATALAKRGFIDGTRLKELKGPVGYRPLATDLSLLATLLRANAAAISGRTAVQPEELDRAEMLAELILTAIGERDQAPAVAAESTLTRQRAYTLFAAAYDDARRAVAYLRWHEGDAEDIAPSLYAGRGGGNIRKRAPEETPTPQPTTPPVSTPTPGAPGNGQPRTPVAPGLPGASPYVTE